MVQADINALLVRLAREGLSVVRLKGGDPFIFGRGGEESQVLAAHGVPFEVVPGITAGCGVSSYAGIPLTHRDHAQTCLFVTGHLKDGPAISTGPRWRGRARRSSIYMGLAVLPRICGRLIAHGLPRRAPGGGGAAGHAPTQRVSAARWPTCPGGRALPAAARPCLIIVGEVVRLRERLAWLDGSRGARARGEAGLALRRARSTANTAASTRELRLSFARMWRTCSFTVSWLMSRARAMALLLSPRARCSRISRWRSVSEASWSGRLVRRAAAFARA